MTKIVRRTDYPLDWFNGRDGDIVIDANMGEMDLRDLKLIKSQVPDFKPVTLAPVSRKAETERIAPPEIRRKALTAMFHSFAYFLATLFFILVALGGLISTFEIGANGVIIFLLGAIAAMMAQKET